MTTSVVPWRRTCTVEEFVQLASSSTQVQRGVSAHGPQVLEEVRALAASAAHDGIVEVPYRCELYLARTASAPAVSSG